MTHTVTGIPVGSYPTVSPLLYEYSGLVSVALSLATTYRYGRELPGTMLYGVRTFLRFRGDSLVRP